MEVTKGNADCSVSFSEKENKTKKTPQHKK